MNYQLLTNQIIIREKKKSTLGIENRTRRLLLNAYSKNGLFILVILNFRSFNLSQWDTSGTEYLITFLRFLRFRHYVKVLIICVCSVIHNFCYSSIGMLLNIHAHLSFILLFLISCIQLCVIFLSGEMNRYSCWTHNYLVIPKLHVGSFLGNILGYYFNLGTL